MFTELETSAVLGSTARWTAAVRALENERSDRLFSDPWAVALAGKTGSDWLSTRTPESVVPIILRTRFFDDFLIGAMNETSIRQVVLLAAGFDTRAFRLDWPGGTRLFELDQSLVFSIKEKIMRDSGGHSVCDRRIVESDLAGAWDQDLVDAGFDPAAPTCWLLEGFLFYVSIDTIVRILDRVTGLSAKGSRIGFDIINRSMLTSPWTKAWIDMQAAAGAPWIGYLDDPAAILAERGWNAALSQAGAPDAHHGRWTLPVFPVHQPGIPHNWFVTGFKE